jgi:hypothetical protein
VGLASVVEEASADRRHRQCQQNVLDQPAHGPTIPVTELPSALVHHGYGFPGFEGGEWSATLRFDRPQRFPRSGATTAQFVRRPCVLTI